jgi:hypothetical protein
MAIARIFLFLSIVRFTLAAPIVVRRVHEVHVDVVDGTEDGAAASQKRWEPWDNWLTNAAPRISALRQLQDLQDFDHLPRTSTESKNAPSTGRARGRWATLLCRAAQAQDRQATLIRRSIGLVQTPP